MECQAEQAHLVAACIYAVCDVEEGRIKQLSIFVGADDSMFFDDEQSARAIVGGLNVHGSFESAGNDLPFITSWVGK